TLISVISAARPKIANYPITTLEPNLGVVSTDSVPQSASSGTGKESNDFGRTLVVADLPVLIEGAHEGAGLGIRFLRHVERTRLLVHLIDTSDFTDAGPIHSFEVINGELLAFSESLGEKPMIVVATKLDATTDRTRLEELRNFCAQRDLPFHAISAATGEGVRDVVLAIADTLDKIPKSTAPHPDAPESAASESFDDFAGNQLHYSVDTVRYFRHTHHGHGDRIFFMIGADAFLDIPMWKEYESLLGLCDFIIANRPGIRADALKLVIPPDLLA